MIGSYCRKTSLQTECTLEMTRHAAGRAVAFSKERREDVAETGSRFEAEWQISAFYLSGR